MPSLPPALESNLDDVHAVGERTKTPPLCGIFSHDERLGRDPAVPLSCVPTLLPIDARRPPLGVKAYSARVCACASVAMSSTVPSALSGATETLRSAGSDSMACASQTGVSPRVIASRWQLGIDDAEALVDSNGAAKNGERLITGASGCAGEGAGEGVSEGTISALACEDAWRGRLNGCRALGLLWSST